MTRVERFDVEGQPRVYLRLPAGEARVLAGDDGVVRMSSAISGMADVKGEASEGMCRFNASKDSAHGKS